MRVVRGLFVAALLASWSSSCAGGNGSQSSAANTFGDGSAGPSGGPMTTSGSATGPGDTSVSGADSSSAGDCAAVWDEGSWDSACWN